MHKQNKSYIFWLINGSGWTLLFLTYLVLYYRDRLDQPKVIGALALTHFAGFLLSIFMRFVFHCIRYQSRPMGTLAVLVVAISMSFSTLWHFLEIFLHWPLYNLDYLKNGLRFSVAFGNSYRHLWVMLLWSAIYFSIKLWKDWRMQQERTEKATALAQAAQLQMLRYQLNPHFLFNALNSIRALVDEDKSKARKVITELSEFLRYTLISKNYSDVPLKHEFEAINHYFEIEKIRFEEKLDISIELAPDAEEFPVPGFLIHPLVENAVKYGMKTSPLPLKIEVKARLDQGKLTIHVNNTGEWGGRASKNEDRDSSTGTGLKNVQKRLENAYPDRHEFQIIKEDGWVKIRLVIG